MLGLQIDLNVDFSSSMHKACGLGFADDFQSNMMVCVLLSSDKDLPERSLP
jgi:hypothetical protein